MSRDVFAAHSDGSAGELHVVGVEQTDAAQLLLQRQGLDLELDAVVAEDVRPDVGLGRRLQFGMPELEDDLGLADGEAVLVGDSAAQNEGIVVEAEVIRVNEQHFADLDRLFDEAFRRVLYAVLFCGLPKDLTEVEEALARVELVGPQDELAADVFGRMDGHAVGILARLELGDASHPTGGYRFAVLWQLASLPSFVRLGAVAVAVGIVAPQWRLFLGMTTLF